ncbi:hypothetical protein RhiLY_12102 [Ceratobasidium sp. AG-Ba]|nr:hypothetical protein RhiLY_12102 [Ceratobasidium sp. AG-Ba]
MARSVISPHDAHDDDGRCDGQPQNSHNPTTTILLGNQPLCVKTTRPPLGFPLPPLTVPRSPPMSPVVEQTKEVEYYRAAPAAPGSHSVDLERVHPVARPMRSPSDPPAVAPLSISKRVKSPPAAIIVPPISTRPEMVRPTRSPARQASYFDADVSPSSSFATADAHASSSRLAPRSLSRGAPGPPPLGPLPPIPDQQTPFTGVDPLVLRAVSARERREARRQSKVPDDKDKEIAALERSMRRLSRISLNGANSPAVESGSGPTSPTISVAGSLGRGESPFPSQVGRAERAEKLLRRISRQSDGIRLPSDYGRVGISGYTVPSSAPVSPGIRGLPSPLRPHKSETETSELAYLADERPMPALSVPMRRNMDRTHSAPGAYAPAIAEPTNALGLGLGLTLTPSDSKSSMMASSSMTALPSISSMSTLPSDATMTTLPSESTIRPALETRTGRLGSLSSASSTAASIHSAHTFETASTTSLLTPISPPTSTTPLPNPPRSPMSPPRQLKLRGTIRHPSPVPLPSRAASPDIPSILAQFRDAQTLPVPAPEVSAVPATRIRPGARPRVHSDLAPLEIPPPVPPKDGPVDPQHGMESTRSSTDSRVAVEDSRSADGYPTPEESNVLEVPPMRQSLESQATPRVAHAARSSAPTPSPNCRHTRTTRLSRYSLHSPQHTSTDPPWFPAFPLFECDVASDSRHQPSSA